MCQQFLLSPFPPENAILPSFIHTLFKGSVAYQCEATYFKYQSVELQFDCNEKTHPQVLSGLTLSHTDCALCCITRSGEGEGECEGKPLISFPFVNIWVRRATLDQIECF